MWMTLLFLLLSASTLRSAAFVVDKETQAIVDSVFAPDLFHRFLLSYPPNASISPCENLYRHFCPSDLPPRHQFSTILVGQVEILRKLQQLNMRDDFDYERPMQIFSEILNKTEFNVTEVSSALYERCFYHGGRVCILDVIDKIVSPLYSQFRSDDEKNYKGKIDVLGHFYRKLRRTNLSPQTLANFATSLMQYYYLNISMLAQAQHRVFVSSALNRLSFLSFLQNGGFMNEKFAAELDAISAEVRAELANDSRRYSWSRVESRFGVRTGTLYHAHIMREVESYLPLDRHDMQLERIRQSVMQLARQIYDADEIVGTPDKRVNVYAVVLNAYHSLTKEEDRRIKNFDIYNSIADYKPSSVTFSHLMLLRLLHNVPTAVKYGGFYSIYAHELQHQLQTLSREFVEYNEFYKKREACLGAFYQDMCHPSMFLEEECHSGRVTFKEDDADLVGDKITLRLFLRRIGKQLKEKPYADMNLTNEQLYFAARTIIDCEEFEYSQHHPQTENSWDEHSGSSVRVNAIYLGTSEFRRTFQCPPDSRMAQPNPFFLERDADGRYPEVDVWTCDPEKSGYSYERSD